MWSTIAAAAEDTDTEEAESLGDWAAYEFQDRRENNLNLEPPDEDDNLLFSRQDCEDDITFDTVITLTGDAATELGDLYLYVGTECSAYEDILTNCTLVAEESASTTTVRFDDVSLSQFFLDEPCADSGSDKMQIWLARLDTKDEYYSDEGDLIGRIGTAQINFAGPTETVGIDDVLIGDDNVEIHFDDVDEDAVDGYVAFYKESIDDTCSDGSLVEGELPTADNVDGEKISTSSDDTSIKIGGLDNGTFYQIAVATLDEFGNPSVLSAPVCAGPQDSIGIGDALETDGEFCFIATAAYGSYEHPTVQVLRTFRDQFLRDLPLGDTIVAAYYSVGPSLAGMIQGDNQAKSMVRSALGLFAGLSTVLVQWGALWVMLGMWSAVALGLLLGFAAPRAKEK